MDCMQLLNPASRWQCVIGTGSGICCPAIMRLVGTSVAASLYVLMSQQLMKPCRTQPTATNKFPSDCEQSVLAGQSAKL